MTATKALPLHIKYMYNDFLKILSAFCNLQYGPNSLTQLYGTGSNGKLGRDKAI